MTQHYVAALAAASLIALACAAHAQSYPTKPVRVIIPAPVGGGVDTIGRAVSQKLQDALGQPFVADNRPGAGTVIGSELTAKAPPDGHTVLFMTNSHAINAAVRKHLKYDALKDFSAISLLAISPYLVVVHPSVPAKSTADLIALAKAKAGGVNFASAGTGSTAHLAGEYFKHMAGIDIVHVPYKGAGPALTDLMGGQVQMLITGYSSAIGHVKNGKLRALAVTGAKRLSANPDLPTIGETVKGYEVTSWYGFLAPRRTPEAIIARLHKEISAVVKRPDVIERLIVFGIEPEGSTPQEFREAIGHEIATWRKVVQMAKVELQ